MNNDIEKDIFADEEDLDSFLEEDGKEDEQEVEETGISEIDLDDEDEADDFGTAVDLETEGLSEIQKEKRVATTYDFMTPDGNLSIMDTKDTSNSFELINELPISSIIVAGMRIRKNPSVTALTQSIKSTGLLYPIVVAPTMTQGTYVLVHGLKRIIASAKVGATTIPAIINKRIKSTEISIVEAVYNQYTPYTMRECADYIKYLETEKGIMSSALFEMLLQWNNGDYAKFKDITDDGDPDIMEKLFGGEFTIAQAFQALEKRRKKESREEKQIKTTAKAYSDEENAEGLVGTGADLEDDGPGLSEDEIKDMMMDPTSLDDNIEEADLDKMVEEGKEMEGFEAHKQDWKDRERIDPAIRKAVMARDKNTCQCCKEGGPDMVDVLDLHHIIEVFLGGEDSVENGLAVCLNCHKQIHLYAYGQLTIPKTLTSEELEVEFQKELVTINAQRKADGLEELTPDEEKEAREEFVTRYKLKQNKFKRIVKLGNKIREGMQKKGMKLEQAKKEHSIQKIGRQKPGVKNQRG